MPGIGRAVLAGELTLGVIPTLAPYVLPRVLPKLQARYPRLQVELRETQTGVLVDELIRGDLDVILLALPVAEADLETMPLFDDPFLLAVPAGDARSRTGAHHVARPRSGSAHSARGRALPS